MSIINNNNLTLNLKRKTFNINDDINNNVISNNLKHHKSISYSIHDPMKIINPFLILRERTIILSINHEWRNSMLQPCCWRSFTGYDYNDNDDNVIENFNQSIERDTSIFKNSLFIARMKPIWIKANQLHPYKNLYLAESGHIINIFNDIQNDHDMQTIVSKIENIRIEFYTKQDVYFNPSLNQHFKNIHTNPNTIFQDKLIRVLNNVQNNLKGLHINFNRLLSNFNPNKLPIGKYIKEHSNITANLSSLKSDHFLYIDLINPATHIPNIIELNGLYCAIIKNGCELTYKETLHKLEKILTEDIKTLCLQIKNTSIQNNDMIPFKKTFINHSLTILTIETDTLLDVHNHLVYPLVKHCINLKTINIASLKPVNKTYDYINIKHLCSKKNILCTITPKC